MFAAELHTRTVPQRLGVAEGAVVVQGYSQGTRLVFTQTVLVEARHALRLTLKTIARVTTGVHLIADRVAELIARIVSADVLEGRGWVERGLSHHLLAEPALVKLLLDVPLLAVVTQMVRGSFALSAEVIMAVETSNPEFTEMYLCRFWEFFTIRHFYISIDFTWAHIHVTAALGAFDQWRLQFFKYFFIFSELEDIIIE
jgi:hypothetical protein